MILFTWRFRCARPLSSPKEAFEAKAGASGKKTRIQPRTKN